MAHSVVTEYRGVMVLGKTGAGKSTVVNAIVGNEDQFPVTASPSSSAGSCNHCDFEITEGDKIYRIKVMDTVGLLDTGSATDVQTISVLKSYAQNHFRDGINLIIFVLREGRFTPEEKNVFDFLRNNFGEDIATMSALIITNCDNKDKKARAETIQEFKRNPLTKQTADFMKAGIYAVGFPPKTDYINLPSAVKAYYEESIAIDKAELWGLVKGSSKTMLSKELFQLTFWDRCTIL